MALDDYTLPVNGLPARAWAICEVLRLTNITSQQRIVGAEVGVWAGELSAVLLRELPALYLYMVDRWCEAARDSDEYKHMEPGARQEAPEHDRRRDAAIERTSDPLLAHRRQIIQMESGAAAHDFKDGLVDFVFIDACHHKAAVLTDLAAWVPLVRKGGVVGGHDIDHPLTIRASQYWDVRGAIAAYFVQRKIERRLILGPDATWFFVK